MARARATLDGFRAFLGEMGLGPGTVDVYVRDVRKAQEVGTLAARLRDDKLAPKTRRHILAAARHWAEYSEDSELTKQLKRIRLPPPRRKTARVPLSRTELFALIDEIERAKYITDAMRGVLGMMATRGFRCGDVLRLLQTELESARSHGTLAYEAKGQRRLEFKLLTTYRRFLLLLANAPGDWNRVHDLISPNGRVSCRQSSAVRAVERALVECAAAAKIWGVHPHRLRRTYAVEYLRTLKGDPEAIVKLTQHMQWANMTTAMEYIDHARGDELDVAAERMFDR